MAAPRPPPGGAVLRWGLNETRSYRRRPVSRRSSANLGGPPPGPRPSPGGAVFREVLNPIRSYRRRPGRAAERCVFSIISAHTGVGRYPEDHPNCLRATPWTPAFAGGSGFWGGAQSFPRITAKNFCVPNFEGVRRSGRTGNPGGLGGGCSGAGTEARPDRH